MFWLIKPPRYKRNSSKLNKNPAHSRVTAPTQPPHGDRHRPLGTTRDHMASAATRILRARGHFEVLGLPREQCTSAAVRAQFTKLVKEVHPDKCSHPDAAAAFRRLQAANDALKATGSRTRHLLREQRRPPDRPSAVAPLLETIGSTRVLAAAAGCLVLAEVCRIAFGEDAVAVEPVAHLVPPEREPTRTPLAPAFSSTAGLPYEGHSKEVIGAKVAAGLEKAAARRRERVAEPPVATRSDLRRPAPMARKKRPSRSVK